MQTVGFNLQPLVSGHLTGIGQYTLHVMKAIISQRPEGMLLEAQITDFLGRNKAEKCLLDYFGYSPDPFTTPSDKGAPSLLAVNPLENENPLSCFDGIRINRVLPFGVYMRGGKITRFLSYQQLFGTNTQKTVFFNFIKPATVMGKSIITIYDMVYDKYPETMQSRNRQLLEKHLPRSCQEADAIVTISHAVKRDIVELLHIPECKVHVAYCGVDRSIFCPASQPSQQILEKNFLKERYRLPESYLLYLGTLEPRKNITTIIKAFHRIAAKYTDLKLVLAGGKGWGYEPVLQMIDQSAYRDRILLPGYVDEQDKPALYRQAELFLFPSLYEGFGMPALEALACGTPVIASNTSSLPEVIGRAGILIAPDDIDGYAAAIDGVLTNEGFRSEMASIQQNQACQFTWTKAASVYINLLR